MSLPPSATGSEGVTIVPPTPTSSAPPSLPEGSTSKKHSGEKVSPPPVQRAVDSGVALEEVLNKALSLKDGNGEEELKRAEEAAVARRPNAPSPHSSGARSAAGNSSNPSHRSQRPSPSSRGSFSNSSRSGNSRTSSGGHPYDHSNRSSFERRPSQYGAPSHTQLPPLSAGQQWASPYAYSPNQRTPSAASSDLMYSLPAFYPSSSFYPPQAGYGVGNGVDPNTGQPFYNPQQQYGQPGFIAFHPFSSPLPSPRVDFAAHYNGGFPFSAAPSPQPVSYPYYPLPGTVVYSTGPPPGTNGGNGAAVYDESGNEVGQSGVEQQPHLAYHPQPQPHITALGYGPPQPGPSQPGGPYQPVYFAPPVAPPPPQVPSVGTQYPIQQLPPQPSPHPSSYPSSAPSQHQPPTSGTSNSSYPIYPINHAPPTASSQSPLEATSSSSYAIPITAPQPSTFHQQTLVPCPPPPPIPFPSPSAAPLPLEQLRRPSYTTSHSRESSSGTNASTQGPPKIYEPPSTPARGQLAQAGLRKAAMQAGVGGSPELPQMQMRRVPSGGAGGARGPSGRRDLPKPPPHSAHALWVGNVPSDASHAELWQFFQTRPVPAAGGVIAGFGGEDLDWSVTGIESIHLIARSNCAFVNYVSDVHLQHAIQVSNGVSLRPGDNRCKPFLCRERKSDDDVKSGVGAQRVGGIHRSYIQQQREQMAERQRMLAQQQQQALAKIEPMTSPEMEKQRRQSGGSVASMGTSTGSGSTSSSFLSKHFERRYFILKSHDEADLRLSVETGLWATQSHNEPVLQQAYRTAKTVYLIFGANGQGCWFGVARMAGPISSATSSTGSRPSWSSRDGGSTTVSSAGAGATLLSQPSQTILEDEASSFPTRPPVLLGESERHFASTSPSGISPAATQSRRPSGAGSAPASLAPPPLPDKVSHAARTAMSIEADLAARETADNLYLPEAIVAKRAASYDDAIERKAIEESALRDDEGDDVTTRQGSLGAEAEKRNRKLEGIVDRTEGPKPTFAAAVASTGPSPQGVQRPAPIHAAWGTPFAVEWLSVQKLPFPRTKHLRNSFNGNREIKVSRDGTEVEPSAGASLLSVFCDEDPNARPLLSPAVSARPSPATSKSAPSAVEAVAGFSFSSLASSGVSAPVPIARGMVGSTGSGSGEEGEK